MNNKIHFRAFRTSRYYIAITYNEAQYEQPSAVIRMLSDFEEEEFAWMLNRFTQGYWATMTEAERKGRQNGEPKAREAECWVEAMLSFQAIMEQKKWFRLNDEIIELNDDMILDIIEKHCYDKEGIE